MLGFSTTCYDHQLHKQQQRLQRQQHHHQHNKALVVKTKKKAFGKATTTANCEDRDDDDIKRGRWEKWEKRAFLRGLQNHGKGKWKTIARAIPTRTTIQVKTHAQMVLKKQEAGVDIYAELRNSKNHDDSSATTVPSLTSEDAGMDDDEACYMMLPLTTTFTVNNNNTLNMRRVTLTILPAELEAAQILAALHDSI